MIGAKTPGFIRATTECGLIIIPSQDCSDATYMNIEMICYFTCFEKWLPWGKCSLLLLGDKDRSEFLVFSPSRSRINRILEGSSSTAISTSVLHSGHRSSRFVPYISSKQRLQNVCWHGRTLLVWSKRSRHTEHSSSSFKDCSSILLLWTLLRYTVMLTLWR